jgi:NRPS condensation-like uncharacterized protein
MVTYSNVKQIDLTSFVKTTGRRSRRMEMLKMMSILLVVDYLIKIFDTHKKKSDTDGK